MDNNAIAHAAVSLFRVAYIICVSMTRQKKRQRDADGGAQEASSSGTDRSTSLSKYAHLKADSLWSQLLGLIEPLDFFSTYFEKKPLLIRERGLKRQLFSKNLFTRDFLLEIVDQYNLSHGADFILCKYIDFKRIDYEVPTRKSDAKICSAMMKACFRDSYSCQFYQPQRYSDDLHRLCASFENTFGCLTGSSVYLTPPKAQALAPHYDDVDVFILQVCVKLFRLSNDYCNLLFGFVDRRAKKLEIVSSDLHSSRRAESRFVTIRNWTFMDGIHFRAGRCGKIISHLTSRRDDLNSFNA